MSECNFALVSHFHAHSPSFGAQLGCHTSYIIIYYDGFKNEGINEGIRIFHKLCVVITISGI